MAAAAAVLGSERPGGSAAMAFRKLSLAPSPSDWATRSASERLLSRPYWVWKNSASPRPAGSIASASLRPMAVLADSRSIFKVTTAV